MFYKLLLASLLAHNIIPKENIFSGELVNLTTESHTYLFLLDYHSICKQKGEKSVHFTPLISSGFICKKFLENIEIGMIGIELLTHCKNRMI